MMASDQLDEIIKEIASKHGTLVSRNDPILVLHTINEYLMKQSAETQQVMLDAYKQELEALSLRWSADAKDKADRIINASLSSNKEIIANLLREKTYALTESMKTELLHCLTPYFYQAEKSKNFAILNIVTSIMTLTAAKIIFFSFG